ncbi:MAG: sulfatase-like hydrolase/transferase [Actinomycetota bacterium]
MTRALMGLALVGALLAPAIASAGGSQTRGTGARVRADRPNVLIIVTDDQRPDTMKFMPATNRLFRRRGVRFSRAFATTPLCCPFRASLMTGQYAHNSGIRRQADAKKLRHQDTMQRYLQDAGYTTALFGKYLNHWPIESPPPYFSHFAMGTGYRNKRLNVEGKLRTISSYIPSYLGRRATTLLDELEQDDDRPWFMMLTPSSPHHPSTPPSRYADLRIPRWEGNPATSEKDLTDKPPMLYPDNTWVGVEATPRQRIYARFARALFGADDLVADVMGTLRRLDENSDTLAFFMSDNGFLMGEHGLRLKRLAYPISMEVPLYMRGPRRFVDGVTRDKLVANIDVLPTVLAATNLEPAEDHVVDGRPLLGGSRRDRLLIEHFADNRRAVPTWASLVTEQEQYTEYYGADEQTVAFREFYDLVTDPWRLTNSLGDSDALNDPDPLTITELSQQLKADRTCAGAACP